MVSFAVGPLARARYAVSMTRRRHLERPDVLHVRASKVSIVGQRFEVNADGELRGPEQRLTWKVVPQRLRMVVPAAQQGPVPLPQ
jgi:diacylglycerol kinase family enzyme